MDILSVQTRKQWRQFIELPYVLNSSNPLWIPPLRIEQKKLFDPQKNVMLRKAPHQLFLAAEGNECVGRVAAFIDPVFNHYWKDKIGFFGSFECIHDQEVAIALLQQCEEWHRSRQMIALRGPINFESQNWGFIVEGFDRSPRILAPFNPPFYNELIIAAGFHKVKDLEVFGKHTRDYVMPERFVRHQQRLMLKYDLEIRPIRMDKMVEDVRILLDLNNRSVAGNWGVAPVSLDEAEMIARSLKDIVRPDLILIIEAHGQPIAFVIVLPEVFNALDGLNGRLFPFGLFKLVRRLKKINEFRFWALGIVPEYQRRGIDSLLYLATFARLQQQDVYAEANYILEDNFAMKDAVIKLGMNKVRTYRVYEKKITPSAGN